MTRHTAWLVAGLLAAGAAARVDPVQAGAEKPSGILVFPRIEVDTARGVDTIVQLSNHSTGNAGLRCFYVNGLGSCGNSPSTICRSAADCQPSIGCVDQCQEIDFILTLTRGQTLGFLASQGLMPPVIDVPPGSVPPTHTDPFFGELKCVQTDPVTDAPVAGNDLIGTATIMHTAGPDAAAYSAIGIESTGRNDGDDTLCLGSNATGTCTAAEYVRCPQELDLNHFFEGANVAGALIENELTLVPCSQTLGPPPAPLVNQVELTVFNEFEERRCGTFSVGCVGDIHFADHPLFSIGVQGTLAGHTRLRAPVGSEDDVGHALLGIALERHVRSGSPARSAAYSLTSEESSAQADFIHIPAPPAPGFARAAQPRPPTKFSMPAALNHRQTP